jgi:hypothetical protein
VRGARVAVAALLAAAGLAGAAAAEPRWKGLRATGTVAANAEQHWKTPRLARGAYQFEMRQRTGDADLYVRVGVAPTPLTYDCRPAKGAATENCFVQLAEPAVIHVMVRGYAPMSTFTLVGRAR